MTFTLTATVIAFALSGHFNAPLRKAQLEAMKTIRAFNDAERRFKELTRDIPQKLNERPPLSERGPLVRPLRFYDISK
jgi:hypothetical protein